MNAALFTNLVDELPRVYDAARQQRLREQLDLYPHVITERNFAEHQAELGDVQVIFSTWGMWPLSDEQLTAMPSLRAVFYAAGSVQHFARPLLDRDIIVVSSAVANGIPVAEFTLAQILLGAKGYWQNLRACTSHAGRTGHPPRGPGIYDATIGVLGAGTIGRQLITRLHALNTRMNILVWDPFLVEQDGRALGVEKVSAIETVFSRAIVVSNHLADKPDIRGLIDAALLERLPPNATFINTGRGAQVDEKQLCQVMARRPDLTALIDVTLPEPPAVDSPLYATPNVHLTSHIAGATEPAECGRLADYVIDQCARFQRGEPFEGQIRAAMLQTLA